MFDTVLPVACLAVSSCQAGPGKGWPVVHRLPGRRLQQEGAVQDKKRVCFPNKQNIMVWVIGAGLRPSGICCLLYYEKH